MCSLDKSKSKEIEWPPRGLGLFITSKMGRAKNKNKSFIDLIFFFFFFEVARFLKRILELSAVHLGLSTPKNFATQMLSIFIFIYSYYLTVRPNMHHIIQINTRIF